MKATHPCSARHCAAAGRLQRGRSPAWTCRPCADRPSPVTGPVPRSEDFPGRYPTRWIGPAWRTHFRVRVPLLDHQLVEWMSGLRPEWKLAGGDGKHPVQTGAQALSAGRRHVPAKQGFSIPLAQWFREPLRESTSEVAWVNPSPTKRAVQQQLSESVAAATRQWIEGQQRGHVELLMFALSDRHLASHSTPGAPHAGGGAERSGCTAIRTSRPGFQRRMRRAPDDATGTRGAEHET